MKIRNAFMALALVGAPMPALAQTANPAHRDAPELNRTPMPDANDRDSREPQSERDYLIDIGYEYAQENYERLLNKSRGGDRNQVTNPYNNSSVTNRAIRRFDPGRIGGGVGRALRDGGFGGGTIIGGMQKMERHDEVMRPHVIQGMEAALEYRAAKENNDEGQAAHWSRVADSHFYNVGRLVERYEQASQEQGRANTQRMLRGQTNRFFRNHRSPLRSILPR